MQRILILALMLSLAACTGGDRRFTAEAWRQADPLDRGVFVDDLVARRLLVGKSRIDVIRMLGSGYAAGDTMTWNVGTDESGRPRLLQVEFRDGVAYRASARHG